MNKLTTLVSITLAYLIAMPVHSMGSDSHSIGLMGSQGVTPLNVNDAALQKAIEKLIKQEKKHIDLKKRIPNKLDNPIGENPLRNSEKVLILGGAEAFPM